MSQAPTIPQQDRPPWFRKQFGSRFSPAMRQLLVEYSKIPAAEIDEHIYSIRERAWQTSPYPCIGGFTFLDFAFAKHPRYKTVLGQLKTEKDDIKFIDIGCCFGQEVRKLAFDGVSHDRLYGSDIHPELLELGFELFRDRDRWASATAVAPSFFPMDIFSPVVPGDIRFDIVYIAMVFHLFSREKQVQAATEIVTKLLVDKPGVIILGSQAGTINARSVQSRRHADKASFLHDVDSFKEMWVEVGEMTGTTWAVDAVLTKPWESPENKEIAEKDRYFVDDDVRWLVFSVVRL
ncbi:hypothetical protein BGW36DRAFT_375195 [Talaromyces proteolyticus]|uniref:Methyltransferase type 11 domain-containing protein n=1 Tax=Talaromyces proteolyticus TaxID=1131652 RepID=A0AAD4KX99_9EURO|nr:uncharacterized protein BGW36DRAFT_375195 [Talaromyces proteolyticus]KAH8700892.1 hypothetical protein BGW36DRAFT_375195 [Talaromyces proteolyticus]